MSQRDTKAKIAIFYRFHRRIKDTDLVDASPSERNRGARKFNLAHVYVRGDVSFGVFWISPKCPCGPTFCVDVGHQAVSKTSLRSLSKDLQRFGQTARQPHVIGIEQSNELAD